MLVGNIKCDNIILAPMSGVTDYPFRKLVRKFGVGLVVSEMIASQSMIHQTRQSIQKSKISKEDISCVQIAGCDPVIMAEAAKMNEDMGAQIIDMNFGCPAKKVVGGFAGSALMKDELLAFKIIESVVNAVKVPVTIKMRLGWDESTKNAPTLAKIAENCGVQMITVHGRTRAQFYSGNADWSFISQIKKNVKVPVIVNGDIKNTPDAQRALELSGADGVMIGRGSYGKPWILAQIKKELSGNQWQLLTIEKQQEIIMEHYEDLLSFYGIENGVAIARKHLGWYSSGFPNSSNFRATINQTSDPENVKRFITNFFENNGAACESSHQIYQ